MSMARQEKLVPRNPFNEFICDVCGRRLGRHWLFRPDKFADTTGAAGARKPNGKLYCRPDQVSYAGSYHQRQLRRTMDPGYAGIG
jgi:hypothetical protein